MVFEQQALMSPPVIVADVGRRETCQDEMNRAEIHEVREAKEKSPLPFALLWK